MPPRGTVTSDSYFVKTLENSEKPADISYPQDQEDIEDQPEYFYIREKRSEDLQNDGNHRKMTGGGGEKTDFFWNINGPLSCSKHFIPDVNQSIIIKVL